MTESVCGQNDDHYVDSADEGAMMVTMVVAMMLAMMRTMASPLLQNSSWW